MSVKVENELCLSQGKQLIKQQLGSVTSHVCSRGRVSRLTQTLSCFTLSVTLDSEWVLCYYAGCGEGVALQVRGLEGWLFKGFK